MLSLDRCWDTHGSRLIHYKDDGDVFLAHNLFVLNLSSCFHHVVDCCFLWLLLFFDANLVFMATEFTFPDLINIIWVFCLTNHSFWLSLSDNTIHIEDSITFSTLLWVSCCDLSIVLQSFEFNLKDICVYFLSVFSCWSVLLRLFYGFRFESEFLNVGIVFFAWEVEVSVKFIRVNVLAWSNIIFFFVINLLYIYFLINQI